MVLVRKQDTIFLNSVFFVLGFTLVFSVVGILFQTILSHASFSLMGALRIIGGLIIIAFGILIVASTKYIIPFFSSEHRITVRRFSNSYLTSLVFGIAFALGWTPCVGAILGSIYVLAATSPGIGFLLLMAYSLGLGIPFLIFGAFISKVSDLMRKIKRPIQIFQHNQRRVPDSDRGACHYGIHRHAGRIPYRDAGLCRAKRAA